ncbi:unnamed protein product [Ectocarpus sp. 6 AP-2014]
MIRSRKQQEQQQEPEDGAMASKSNGTAVVPSDPLAGLSESERLALLIRFGAAAAGPKGGGMCAAMSHGHSFQSSIFRLPAKCSACHELVWGPFTRGCTCLTCSVTVHRSCTGAASLPRCPTKDVFDAFCRSELGLPPPPPPPPPPVATGSPSASASTATGSDQGAETPGGKSPANCGGGGGGGAAHTSGDLDEWATVDGTSAHSTSAAVGQQQQQQQQQQPSSAASCAVQDLGSSFSWSPLGLGERKRPTSPVVSERQQQEERSVAVVPAGDAAAETRTAAGDAGDTVSARGNQGASGAAPTTATDLAVAADASASSTTASMGIRGVTKLSVAGGVVGALFGGPVGAVFGLQVGAVLGAGRSVQQGLWQRIEKSRREAGAEGIRLPKGADGSTAAATAAPAAPAVEETAAREPRDLWARIAGEVESEHQPTIWELAPEQEKLLEQGECNAGEVAMFVVGKVLADETAMLFHLHAALLTEFRSRHDSSRSGGGGGGCTRPVPIRRRSSDTDMVALFPRSSGSRRCPPAAAAAGATAAAATDDGGFFASTPGLEKTFSFVEEAEIVAGEGSDTPGSDDDDGGGRSSADDDDERSGDRRGRRLPTATRAHRWSKPVRSEAAGLASAPATAAVAVTAGRRSSVGAAASAAAVAARDSWRSNSSRMDSWVQLEGGVCGNCGGRVAGRHPVNGGGGSGSRSTRGLVGDVEEDEGGLGDGWAAAEAPVCWCRDEGGLSASPEDAPISVLANAPPPPRQNAVGYGGVAVTTGADRGTKPDKTESGAGADQNGLDRPQNGCCPAAGAGATAAAASTEAGGGDEDARGDEDALRDVHGVLRELTQAVLAWCPQLTSSHEAQIQAVNCIDQRVFSETYGPVFGRIASSGAARDGDASLARRVQREERSRAAAGRPPLLSACRPEVVSALRAAGSARTGRDKLGFLVRAAEKVSDALPAEQRTTDALIFSVCRHLAAATTAAVVAAGGGGDDDAQAAALPRPHAEVAFVEQFMRDESWVMGKEGYVLTTVIAALHVLNSPELSDDIFLDASPPPPPPSPVPNHEEGAASGYGDVSFVVEDVLL